MTYACEVGDVHGADFQGDQLGGHGSSHGQASVVSSSRDEGKGHLSVFEIYKIEAVMCLFQTIFHEADGFQVIAWAVM